MALALNELLSRAQTDSRVLADLAERPLETALAAGVRVSTDELKALLHIPGATDRELVDLLRQRITLTEASPGCGLCGSDDEDDAPSA